MFLELLELLDNRGINIDGDRLNQLGFADDIVLISDNLRDA